MTHSSGIQTKSRWQAAKLAPGQRGDGMEAARTVGGIASGASSTLREETDFHETVTAELWAQLDDDRRQGQEHLHKTMTDARAESRGHAERSMWRCLMCGRSEACNMAGMDANHTPNTDKSGGRFRGLSILGFLHWDPRHRW